MFVKKIWKERAYEQYERAEALEVKLDEMRQYIDGVFVLESTILKPILDLQHEAKENGLEPKQVKMPYKYWADISQSLVSYLAELNATEYEFNRKKYAGKILGMNVVVHSKDTIEVV